MSNKGRTIKRLDQKQFYNLVQYVQREYVASDVSDKGFAEQASKKLGYDVSESSVASAREIVGVAPWRDRNAVKVEGSWLVSFEALRKRVEALNERLVAQEDANGRMHNRIHTLEDDLRRLKEVVKDMTFQLDRASETPFSLRQPHSGQG